MPTCDICGAENVADKMIRSAHTKAYYCGPPLWQDCESRSLGLIPKASGLCERCGENEQAPGEDWCRGCVVEVEMSLAKVEDAA